ncbi:response regulator [Hymenobacter sp. GOD-10R]|uniref:response regulator n=1 Tax=Hymenobacter sp. GOD-10R TaxID=3093922 RepID=UPI002D79B2E5|nr:response regulator [Hymenobacter sp. GOD-10R]WRQ27670.1 response regulator [Hymenobacter sp. GOD-10R]
MKKLPSVLLVDDDVAGNFLNRRLLERMRVAEHLHTAESGYEALTWLGQENMTSPSLLLLDVRMPGMSGMQFLEAYQPQRQEQAQPTVVIMLTTAMDSRDLLRLDELQIDGLVSKPLTEEKINHVLQLHFRQQLALS